MKLIYRTILLSLVVSLFSSCTEEVTYDSIPIEQLSLDAWVDENRADATSFIDGMYITTLEPTKDPVSQEIVDGDWVYLNYVGTDLHGNVFSNRYEDVARRLGTCSNNKPYTHYTPQLVRVVRSSGGITDGQYEALKTMNIGDSVELIMPSSVAYGEIGSEFTGGYGGGNGYNLASSKPAIVTMMAMAAVQDITAHENKLVFEYAEKKWGAIVGDTIAENLYADITYELNGNQEPMGAVIALDSVFQYYYVGRFIDGVVFDTNVADTASRVWNINIAGLPLTYSNITSAIPAFSKVVLSNKLRYGATFKMVFPSLYGYGEDGSASARGTVIQKHTPLVFEVTILDWKAPVVDDDDDEE